MFIILVYKIFSSLFLILEIEMCLLYEIWKIEMKNEVKLLGNNILKYFCHLQTYFIKLEFTCIYYSVSYSFPWRKHFVNIFLLQVNMLPYYDFKSFLGDDFNSIIFNSCRVFLCMNLMTLNLYISPLLDI